MKEFKGCIFCGKTIEELGANNPLTEEHLIPNALGNDDIKFNGVCKKCNSDLGTYVDNYVCNNRFVVMERQNLGLKGQSNTMPNSFKKGITDEGLIINTDINGKQTVQTKVVEDEDGKIFHIHGSNRDEVKKAALKKLERSGASPEKIDAVMKQIDAALPKKIQPSINYDGTYDINRFKLEALKIAYEYGVLELGDMYLEDPRCVEIKSVLNRAISGEFKENCIDIDKVSWLYSADLSCLKHLEHKAHFLQFMNLDGILVLFISLFSEALFTYQVIVSNNANQYVYPTDPYIVFLDADLKKMMES